MKNKDWIAFIALGMIWGSSFLWIKIAVSDVGPFLLVAIRFLISILGLLVVVIARRPTWPIQKQTWIYLTLLGITNNGLPNLLISWGEQYIDSAIAAILNSTVPLFTMLIAHFALSDDRLTPTRLVALLTGFTGVVILVSRDLNGTLHRGFQGQIAVIIAAISYAFSAVLARRTTQQIDPILRTLIPLFGADLILWGVTPIVEAPLRLPNIPLTWIAIVWLGLIGNAVAFMLYFHLIHTVGPTRTSLVTYIFPLVGIVLGIIFLKETLDWHLGLGTVFIVGSIILVNGKA